MSSQDEEQLREFREWVGKELPHCRQDDLFLRRFLTGCKMRLDVAKRKIKNLQTLIRDTPEWFENRDPALPAMETLLKMGVFVLLPRKDEQDRTIVVVRATINNPRTQPMADVFKVGMMVLDAALEEDESIAQHGVVVIIDLSGVSMSHAIQMTPSLIRKAVYSWQDCYPVPIKRIVFIHCPFYVSTVLNIFKSFMRDKLRRRVQTYTGNNLNIDVTADLLPVEYGGTQGSIQHSITHWSNFTKSKRLWFLGQGNSLP